MKLVLALAAVVVLAACVESGKPCKCSKDYRPVCGNDGVTYPNVCLMRCVKGVKKDTDGPCPPPPCICTNDLNPVCGANGVTYDNGCIAECNGQTWTAGACP